MIQMVFIRYSKSLCSLKHSFIRAFINNKLFSDAPIRSAGHYVYVAERFCRNVIIKHPFLIGVDVTWSNGTFA